MRWTSLILILLLLGPLLADEQEIHPYFEVEKINTGLSDFQSRASKELSTPERALSFFERQAKDGNFSDAAMALNLNEIAPENQTSKGPELARQLYEVMHRKTGFPYGRLPDRVDGQLPEAPGGENALGGRPRSAFLIATLELDVGQFEIYLCRYRTPELENVWLFAPSTVGKLDLAYQAHGPSWWEEYIPSPLRHRPFGNTPIWSWIALVVGLGAAWMMSHRLSHWLEKRLNYALFRSIRWGCAVAATSWLTYVLLFPWVPLPSLVSYALVLVGFFALVWLVSTVMDHYSKQIVRADIDSIKELDDRDKQHQKRQLTYLSIGRRLLSFLVFCVGIGILAAHSPQFRTFGVGVLASAGVLSVLLGIAAQPILWNVMAGIQIAISRPVRVGDAIEYEGTWCYVEEIAYMHVLCCTWDERRLVIPLRYFISKPFSSFSLRDPQTIRIVELNLDYLVDINGLREEFFKLYEDHELASAEFEPRLEVVSFDERSVVVRGMVAAKNAAESWDLHCDIREGLLRYLQASSGEALPRLRIRGSQSQRSNGHSERTLV
ncbi:MAG: mechanosensitive ion channel family protein [Candidatus Eremiobacteraeota bacterium]|nr:mechanosensitive ion channel family protein [Candidatus Eremiobacteraeota bacterium]